MNETKICKVCNLEYHISDFKTGIQTIKKYNKCKKCRNAKNFWGFDNLDFETKMKFVLC